jgi:hypothetical protein
MTFHTFHTSKMQNNEDAGTPKTSGLHYLLLTLRNFCTRENTIPGTPGVDKGGSQKCGRESKTSCKVPRVTRNFVFPGTKLRRVYSKYSGTSGWPRLRRFVLITTADPFLREDMLSETLVTPKRRPPYDFGWRSKRATQAPTVTHGYKKLKGLLCFMLEGQEAVVSLAGTATCWSTAYNIADTSAPRA